MIIMDNDSRTHIDYAFPFGGIKTSSSSLSKRSLGGVFCFEDDMKKIPLTQGKFALVDDEDYEWLSQWKWRYEKGYAVRSCLDKNIRMHRVILNAPGEYDVDHIDGNGLNNCKSNIRTCTTSQNLMNRKPKHNGTSIYKGVCWDKSRKKWIVKIGLNGKTNYVGRYKNEVQAAKAHDNAVFKYHEEFARLNFPTTWRGE